MKTIKRVCILANSARYIWNFRINLMLALRSAGYDVIAVSPEGVESQLIERAGFRHRPLLLSPQGINPLKELQAIQGLRSLLDRELVDVVLSSTPKGNLYTAMANIGAQRFQIANVSGLGSAFLRQNWLTHIIDALYSLTFRRIDYVLFENPADHQDFIRRGWVCPDRAKLIPGLGVDLNHFSLTPIPEEANEIRFLMIARLIGDKGVREYAEAAGGVRKVWPMAKFELLGDHLADNPTRISKQEILGWVSRGDIIHHEHTNDVRPYIARAHCLVLPSYREGMSRTLLEGGAMGRPLIAADVPGCREAVADGVNGFLCEARSANSLVDAFTRFLSMKHSQRVAMGAASRSKIASEFGEDYVIHRYVSLLSALHRV